ncbi:DUF7010 family protein [uncultured Draconibacterium sp.]|uniref:DUF7010 family protein n=1 Tax=uncultured Draconibacterium sp. TaxID=1573823 RepID=UPI002AA955EE|nr:hypothetical protein [uncultured Draconibacterium sp.]
MMTKTQLDALRIELSIKAKNGIDFILAATIIWCLIAVIWTLPFSAYDRSVFTFIAGSFLLPLAFGLSKLLKTSWKIPENPLQPLGLWLNFAQLFYFPFLVFILIKHPDYFLMTYAIITGAHFFPYAWYYNNKAYAVMAGIISVGSLLVALRLSVNDFYLAGFFMAVCLFILAIWNYIIYQKRKLADKETSAAIVQSRD